MGFLGISNKERIKVGDRYFYIIKQGNKRILKSGGRFSSSFGIIYSILDTKSIFTNSYPDMFLPLPRLYTRSKVLVIGLAGGTIPYQLTSMYGDAVSVDVVEIDKAMLQVPKLFLGNHKQKWNVYIEDGLDFVERSEKKYDIIALDAYNEDIMPAEFVSDRFVKAAYSALTTSGILAINLTTNISPKHYSGLVKQHFNVYVYSNELGNSFIIGSKHFDLAAIKNTAKRLSSQNGAEYLSNVYNKIKEME